MVPLTHLINIIDRHDGISCEYHGDAILHVLLNGGGIVVVVERWRVVVDIGHRDGHQCGGCSVAVVYHRRHLFCLYAKMSMYVKCLQKA